MNELGFEIIIASSWKEVVSLTQPEPMATQREEWAGAIEGFQLWRRANICTTQQIKGSGREEREGGREREAALVSKHVGESPRFALALHGSAHLLAT